MISPSIPQLTRNGKFNRYALVIATSKVARDITDEYVRQREFAERRIANKETDKCLASMIKREYRDDKAVKSAINKLYVGDYVIVGLTDDENFDFNDADDEDDIAEYVAVKANKSTDAEIDGTEDINEH